MKRMLTLVVTALAALAFAAPSFAATTTLFGGATQQNGTISLVSNLGDATTANDFSGVEITNLGGLTLGNLEVLAAQFNVTDDGCAGGSPRFVITLANGAAVNVALGPAPSFNTCAQNTWLNSGNLIGQLEGCRWHITSPASLADACLTAAELQALANQTITSIRLVVDAGWAFADQEQTVLVRNILVNTTLVAGTVTNGQLNPAKTCKALRAAMNAVSPTLFATTFGTNANRRNAYGKCVSMMAKAKRSGSIAAVQTAVLNAVAACSASGAIGNALTQCVLEQVRPALALVATTASTTKAKKKGKGRR